MKELEEALSEKQITKLRRAVNCQVLPATDPAYDQVRRVWNGMVDRKPSLIVRASGIADVIQAVRFAGENGLAALCSRWRA